MLRRVKKSESAPAVIAEDKYFYCLDCWKLFMSRSDQDLGAKAMALPAGPQEDREAYSSNASDEQYKDDIRIGWATDAAINSMPRLHIWSMFRLCGLATVWNFPNSNWSDVAEHAEINLRAKLRNNLVTAQLFI